MKHLDEVFDYFNSMPTAAIKNIKPDEAFQKKKKRTIHDINYEKSLKNNVESDIHFSDNVRILQKKKQFLKGTGARYSDDVYTVKKSMANQ